MNADEFDKAITIRANAYARRTTDDMMPPNVEDVVLCRADLNTLLARAFVLGVAAGIEVERGPTDRRPSRGKVRR